MMLRLPGALLLAGLGVTPAAAVGLGPLAANGATLTDRKGFI